MKNCTLHDKAIIVTWTKYRRRTEAARSERMTKPSNDEIERRYFEQFCKIYALPDGPVEYGDKPDIIVRGKKTIGIELTNFFVQPGDVSGSEQRQRPLRDKVVADAQRRYLARGGKRVEFTFGFDKNNPILGNRMEALSDGMETFARSHDDESSGAFDVDLFQNAMPELGFIYFNAGEYADAKWRIAQVHRFGLMSKDHLQAIVREKDSKAAQYEECNAYWLLVVVDGMDAAQEQEIRIDDLYIGSRKFEKIIIFHTFGHFKEFATKAA